MVRFFKLKPSRTELYAVYALLLFAIWLNWTYLDIVGVQIVYLLATLILAIEETRKLLYAGACYLCIDRDQCGLVEDTGSEPYLSGKNKVYRTRWFVILRLCYCRKSKIVLLLPDCFDSFEAYRDCRYLLSRGIHGR